MELQVLVASMHQRDFSLIDKMNIRTDAIIANQTSANGFEEKNYEFGSVTMISTQTRGVGLNRNIALLASKADILLFADDDIHYYDGELKGVKEAFRINPRADVILFSVDISRDGQIIERRYNKRKRAHIWNSMKYGTYVIAVRRKSLLKANLKFNELFGGGCSFSCGEDSIFIKSCFEKCLKVYTDPYVLGERSKDSSSWFTGFNEKYLYDKGILFHRLFPGLKHFMAVYYGWRMRKKTHFFAVKNIVWIEKGIRNAHEMKTYDEYCITEKKKGSAERT